MTVTELWPIKRDNSNICTSKLTISEANVCRSSWNFRDGIPSTSAAGLKA
nr:hypothetical protein [Arthrobacter livingstonensis]